jgi:hypothetical protein
VRSADPQLSELLINSVDEVAGDVDDDLRGIRVVDANLAALTRLDEVRQFGRLPGVRWLERRRWAVLGPRAESHGRRRDRDAVVSAGAGDNRLTRQRRQMEYCVGWSKAHVAVVAE